MKTCPSCGKEVMENFETCFHCGASLKVERKNLFTESPNLAVESEKLLYVFAVLATIFFPFLGIVLGIFLRRSRASFARVLLFLGIMMLVFRVIFLAVFVIFAGA